MKVWFGSSWKLVAAALVVASGPAFAQSTQGNGNNNNGPTVQTDLITIQSAGGNVQTVTPPGAGDRDGDGCLTGKPVCVPPGTVWHCGWPNGGHQPPSC